jgi:cysteine desulfurase/selenocysteine lyase
MLGPKRTGILYVREDLLDTLRSTVVGTYSDQMVNMEERTLELHRSAQRYEFGTQNEALFYGLDVAARFISAIGLDAISAHNQHLANLLWQGLQGMPGLEVLSPREERFRSSMITFRFQNHDYRQACTALSKKRIRVRPVGEAGLNAIRVSCHIYNNEDEIARLLSEVGGLARG